MNNEIDDLLINLGHRVDSLKWMVRLTIILRWAVDFFSISLVARFLGLVVEVLLCLVHIECGMLRSFHVYFRNKEIITDFVDMAGKRRYDRKQSGYGGQTKPVFHKKVRFILGI